MQGRSTQVCCVLFILLAVALGATHERPPATSAPTPSGSREGRGPKQLHRAGARTEHQQWQRRPPPREMCQMTLRRERAEARLNRGAWGQSRTGSVFGTALSWVIPSSGVYLSPFATAGLAALPPVLMIYLLWSIHTGRSTMKALCQCWFVVATVSLLLRWHVVTIVVEHLGVSASFTVWQWFTTPDVIGEQLAQAFTVGNRDLTIRPAESDLTRGQQLQSSQLKLYDSSHSAVLPLDYLVAGEFIPQLQTAPGSPARRFQLLQAPKKIEASRTGAIVSDAACSADSAEASSRPTATRLVSFEDATLLDADNVRRAAAAIASSAASFSKSADVDATSYTSSFADGVAIAAAFGEQLASHGFVRLKVRPSSSTSKMGGRNQGSSLPAATAAVQTEAASVFHRSRVDKLGLSSRLWEPEPAGRCICVGYCAQDCARE